MNLKQFLIPFFFGFIGIFAFSPFSIKPLIILSYSYLIRELVYRENSSLKKIIFWSFGHWGFGMSWLIVSVYYYGETSIAISLIIFILLILTLTLFFSLPLLIIRTSLFQDLRHSSLKYILIVISLFMLNEWSMYYLLNGVPWLIPGVVFLDTFSQNIYPLFGVAGASIIVYLCSTLLAISWHKNKKNLLILSLISLIFFIPNFYKRDSIGEQINISIIQPSSDPFLKYTENYKTEIEANLKELINTASPTSSLIILPEAELPYAYKSSSFNEFESDINTNKTIIGGVWHISKGNLYNSMVNFKSQQIYNKVHLVPFGEYIPFISSLRGLISFFDMPMSDVINGKSNQNPMVFDLQSQKKMAPLICFDIAFGNTVRKSNISSLFMVNISNDTWFGKSIGPYQHLDIARIRSIENNKWMIRATNDGFSALIDNNGTIVDKLDKGVTGVLDGSIMLLDKRTVYSQYGYYLPYILAFFILFISVILKLCLRKQY